MYWQSNFDAVMSLMKEATEQNAPAFLCTVRGSIHVSQSDFTLLYPHVCSFFLKATVHPQRAIDLNISASLEFLREVTEGAGRAIIKRCMTDEKLLHTNMLEQLPDAQKPDDQYIAARLKVPHEFRTRVAARLQRKLKRTKKHGFYDPGDEVWMHFKPDMTDVIKWREEAHGKKYEAEEDREEVEEEDTTAEVPLDAPGENWLGQPPSLRDDPPEQ